MNAKIKQGMSSSFLTLPAFSSGPFWVWPQSWFGTLQDPFWSNSKVGVRSTLLVLCGTPKFTFINTSRSWWWKEKENCLLMSLNLRRFSEPMESGLPYFNSFKLSRWNLFLRGEGKGANCGNRNYLTLWKISPEAEDPQPCIKFHWFWEVFFLMLARSFLFQ